jgi:hypothetical protein
MPGLKKNLNLLVNYDPSNGVIQPEQLLQEVRMRHIQVGLFLATIVLSRRRIRRLSLAVDRDTVKEACRPRAAVAVVLLPGVWTISVRLTCARSTGIPARRFRASFH